MKKLYIISNYTTALYELDENDNCKIPGQGPTTIDKAIEAFKQNPTVKVYGILKAVIQEHTEEKGWRVIKQLIPKEESVVERIRKRIPLKTSIFVTLQMDDYDNWEKGEYRGDNDKLIKQTEWILKDVFDWIDRGMPGGRDTDLSYYKNVKSSPFINVGNNDEKS